MSPCQPIVHACVLAGLLSNSAVPVFTCTGAPGTSPSAVAVPDVTTSRIIARRAATDSALSALPSAGGLPAGPAGGAGAPEGSSGKSLGCFHEPRATAAAAAPRLTGLTNVWPCPNAAAAASTLDTFVGTDPVNAGVPRFHVVPMPTVAPALLSPSPPSLGASEAN